MSIPNDLQNKIYHAISEVLYSSILKMTEYPHLEQKLTKAVVNVLEKES